MDGWTDGRMDGMQVRSCSYIVPVVDRSKYLV